MREVDEIRLQEKSKSHLAVVIYGSMFAGAVIFTAATYLWDADADNILFLLSIISPILLPLLAAVAFLMVHVVCKEIRYHKLLTGNCWCCGARLCRDGLHNDGTIRCPECGSYSVPVDEGKCYK